MKLSQRELIVIRRAAEDAVHAANRHYAPFIDAVAHPLNIIALVDMASKQAEVDSLNKQIEALHVKNERIQKEYQCMFEGVQGRQKTINQKDARIKGALFILAENRKSIGKYLMEDEVLQLINDLEVALSGVVQTAENKPESMVNTGFLSGVHVEEKQSTLAKGQRVKVDFISESRTEFSGERFCGEGVIDRYEDDRFFGRLDDGRPFVCMPGDVIGVYQWRYSEIDVDSYVPMANRHDPE